MVDQLIHPIRNPRGFTEYPAAGVVDELFNQVQGVANVDVELLQGFIREANGAVAVPLFDDDQEAEHGGALS